MISEYDCTIEYIAGKANTQADMLSRIPMVHDREAGIHSAPRDKVPSEPPSGHSCMEGRDGATVHHGKVGVINSNRVDPRRCPGVGNESEGPLTRSKHKRINRIKGSNSNKKDSSNKESVKNLLEAIAALV